MEGKTIIEGYMVISFIVAVVTLGYLLEDSPNREGAPLFSAMIGLAWPFILVCCPLLYLGKFIHNITHKGE